MIVNDEYKLLYCYVPKVACSNWKRVFLLLSGHFNNATLNDLEHSDVHFQYRSYLKNMSAFSQEEADYRIRNYRKIIFVREPLERLLSAYRDKFIGVGFRDTTFQNIAKKIIDVFRPRNKTGNSDHEHVTFKEFVKFVLKQSLSLRNGSYDEHWERIVNLCHPCYVKYDFVGKYENLQDDADHILSDLGLSAKIQFPKRSEFYGSTKTIETFNEFYNNIPPEYLASLWKIYRKDYILFNYSFTDVLKRYFSD